MIIVKTGFYYVSADCTRDEFNQEMDRLTNLGFYQRRRRIYRRSGEQHNTLQVLMEHNGIGKWGPLHKDVSLNVNVEEEFKEKRHGSI